ncbi:protein aubergine-like [Culicoides brevitarsis]|uniref:protein aubergine-like n=1 Tax=Culicoides brevitarsis TaxID=469753 RepID=UPI00307C1CCB
MERQGPSNVGGRSPPVKSTTSSPESRGSGATRAQMRGRRYIAELVHTRPDIVGNSKKGSTGAFTTLSSNYFRLVRKPEWSIFQYRVDFQPDIDSVAIRKALFRKHAEMFSGFMFDGTMLFSNSKLEHEITHLISQRLDGTQIVIVVKFTKQVMMTEMASLQVLNLILRRAMEGLNLQLVGRNFFDAVAKIPINEFRLELWPGYVTSIRQHENDILMCAEISTKVMRMETALDVLSRCTQGHGDFREVFAKSMMGTTVLTDYSNKTYRISDVDWKQSPMSTFETKSGPVTYVEYYKKKYNITIRDTKQPLLISKSEDKRQRSGECDLIALVPELCRLTGLTDEMRSNFRLMKAVAEHTRVGPAQRVRRLLDFNRRLINTPASMKTMQDWNLSLEQELVEVTGRELLCEGILFANQEVKGKPQADWSSDLVYNQLFATVALHNWALVTPRRALRESTAFVKVLQDAVRKMGMAIHEPRILQIDGDRNDDILAALEDASRGDPQMILIVVPNNNASRYATIKKKCCVDRAIPTQVIVQRTITPKNGNPRSLMSVATKVAIQLNTKLGAVPWSIKMPLKGLMVVGFDVSHDTKSRNVSYGALVATMDMRENCKYYSAVSSHTNGEELTNHMTLNMLKAIREYQSEHGTFPAKIIIYRDGVGDGQLHYVADVELQAMRKALEEAYAKAQSELRMAYVIVNKRINTRLFKRGQNPMPGTVVDDVITCPERYDFFLVSQTVRQGTVSPTLYNVIHDSLLLPPDKMQILTYKLCHLYFNWNGTIRVPAVCQYAHKLAQLVGEHIHQAPNSGLNKKLFFL